MSVKKGVCAKQFYYNSVFCVFEWEKNVKLKMIEWKFVIVYRNMWFVSPARLIKSKLIKLKMKYDVIRVVGIWFLEILFFCTLKNEWKEMIIFKRLNAS